MASQLIVLGSIPWLFKVFTPLKSLQRVNIEFMYRNLDIKMSQKRRADSDQYIGYVYVPLQVTCPQP